MLYGFLFHIISADRSGDLLNYRFRMFSKIHRTFIPLLIVETANMRCPRTSVPLFRINGAKPMRFSLNSGINVHRTLRLRAFCENNGINVLEEHNPDLESCTLLHQRNALVKIAIYIHIRQELQGRTLLFCSISNTRT